MTAAAWDGSHVYSGDWSGDPEIASRGGGSASHIPSAGGGSRPPGRSNGRLGGESSDQRNILSLSRSIGPLGGESCVLR
jgi:hypothetical protein